MDFDAIVLAGEQSARLGGSDKALVDYEGTTLLERALDAVGDAQRVVVVGPRRHLPRASGGVPRAVAWVQEDPPGAGPAAALAAGLAAVRAEWLLVLAVDHPLVTQAHVARLVAAAAMEGALGVDDGGREQPLLAVYRARRLEEALARSAPVQGASVRDVIAPLSLVRVELGAAARDCDTWEDLYALPRAAQMRR